MKIKYLVLSLFGIILLLGFAFFIRNEEIKGKSVSIVQNAVKKEVENDLSDYINSWKNKKLPNLIAENSNGDMIKINDNLSSKKIFLVWASWCSDCQRELPIIQKLFVKYGNKIDFVSVDLVGFRGETVEKGRSYYKKNNFSFPVYFDTKQGVYNQLSIKAIPSIYFINKEGNIKNIIIEKGGEKKIINNIEKVISE